MLPSFPQVINKATESLHFLLAFIIFLFLDFLDSILCIVYGYLDHILEGKPSSCYCTNDGKGKSGILGMEVSETLYGRKNVFRVLGLVRLRWRRRRRRRTEEGRELSGNRWSDCGCGDCLSWMKNDGGDLKLHVVVQEPSAELSCDSREKTIENVVFLHGFISSSSCWTETVFKHLSEETKLNHRLVAIDLLGFGRSPKPQDCLYTIGEHLEMIEKSVISPYQLDSFHLVAHSMGCVIAIALAAKYPQRVKSLTLVAPPYFPVSSELASLYALRKLAKKRLWPPLLFGAAFMSWYEHLGRTICFLVCRNHRIWESILKMLTRERDLHYMVTDSTRHTHHSAWHSMHNVLGGGAALVDDYLESLRKHSVKISVIHGDQDQVVPLECSYNVKMKVPEAELRIIPKSDHCGVIVGRAKEFTRDMEKNWISSQ